MQSRCNQTTNRRFGKMIMATCRSFSPKKSPLLAAARKLDAARFNQWLGTYLRCLAYLGRPPIVCVSCVRTLARIYYYPRPVRLVCVIT